MADSMGEWNIGSLQNLLIPILSLLGITQASIKINTQAWEYDAPTRKFVPVEESKVQGLAFSFPSGTLTLAESLSNGITTTFEAGTVAHPDRIARAAERVGAHHIR